MEKLYLEQFKSYRSLSDLKWSPDGSYAAFIINSINEDNDYDANIYLYESATGSVKRLTAMGKEKSFLWQDNETILFPSMRSEKYKKQMENMDVTVFYRIHIKGGEAEEAFVIPLKVKNILLASGGNIVVSAAFEGNKMDLSNLSGEEKERVIKTAREEKDVQVVDEMPWWANGSGFTNKKRTRLYIFNTETKTVTPVTGPLYQVNGFRLSPCKGYIMYHGFQFEHTETKMTGLYLYNIATGENRTLLVPNYAIVQADFLNESTIVFAGTDQKAYGLYTNPWFYTVDILSGKLTLLAKYDCNVCNIVLGDCRLGGGTTFKAYGGSLYFTGVVKYTGCLNRLSADGNITRVIEEDGGVDCFDIGQSGIIYIGMMGQRLQELYTFSTEKGGKKRITSINEAVYTNYYVAQPEHISFVESDGFTIDGWVLYPFEYDPQKKYPVILCIHGGPQRGFRHCFFQ